MLRPWQENHPRIEVSLLAFPHRRLLDEAVRDGAGDIAAGSCRRAGKARSSGSAGRSFMVVLPSSDPLLSRRSVQLVELADRRWVHFAPLHGLAEVLDF